MAKNQFTPLQTGNLCPFSSTEWEDSKRKWNCPDPEFYHCIPDQYNQPGEICVKPNWASKNYCPIFNTAAKDIDLIPCDLQYGACSDKDYRSNKVYQYAGCLNKTLVIRATTTESAHTESPIQLPIIIPAVIAPLALLLLVILGVAIYCRRHKGAKSDAGDIESRRPLLHQNEVPLSFRKAENYVENVFCPVNFYEDAIGCLSTFGHITLIGPPGSGKTLLALRLARRLLHESEGKSQLMFFKTLKEITMLPDLKGVCHYIIMDDWLEHDVYYPSKIKEDTELIDHIFDDFVKTQTVQIIFTIQEDRWHKCKKILSRFALFSFESYFSLDDEKFTKEGLQLMVKNHFNYHKIKESSMFVSKDSEMKTLTKYEMVVRKGTIRTIAKKLKGEKEFSLPVMIDLICANRRLMVSRKLIFKDGFKKILQLFLDNWLNDNKKDEKDSFCILVFAALRGGKVSLTDFKSSIFGHMYERICDGYNSNSLEDTESIEKLLRHSKRLNGCLYQEDENTFVFHHVSLLCFVLHFVVRTKNAQFLITNADIDVLLKRCWIIGIKEAYEAAKSEKVLSNPVGAIILPIEVLKELATRIKAEMQKGHKIPDWHKHVFFTHETFCTMWEKANTESQPANLETLNENLPKSDKSQVKVIKENKGHSQNEEITEKTESSAELSATGNDLSSKGLKKNSRQSKQKGKEGKDKASNDKTDSSKKLDTEEETRPKSLGSLQQNKFPSDLTKADSAGNDSYRNGHAENSRQKKHKTKKNEDKISLVKSKGKFKNKDFKEDTKESCEETLQQKKSFITRGEGETEL